MHVTVPPSLRAYPKGLRIACPAIAGTTKSKFAIYHTKTRNLTSINQSILYTIKYLTIQLKLQARVSKLIQIHVRFINTEDFKQKKKTITSSTLFQNSRFKILSLVRKIKVTG